MVTAVTVSLLCLAGAVFCGCFFVALRRECKPEFVCYLVREKGLAPQRAAGKAAKKQNHFAARRAA